MNFTKILQISEICANNAAKLDSDPNKINIIENSILPIFAGICEQIQNYKIDQISEISSRASKYKLYNNLVFLDKFTPSGILKSEFQNQESAFSVLYKAAHENKKPAKLSVSQKEINKIFESQFIKFESNIRIDHFIGETLIKPDHIIEFIGKDEFYKENTDCLIANRLIKNSYLKRKNYKVHNISYKEWETPELRKKSMDKLFFELNINEKFADI